MMMSMMIPYGNFDRSILFETYDVCKCCVFRKKDCYHFDKITRVCVCLFSYRCWWLEYFFGVGTLFSLIFFFSS